MYRFRTALTQLIHDQGWTQQNFAHLLNTDPANISRWLSGKSAPDSSTVGKILLALPEEFRSDLLTAYLKDQIPERFDTMVKVEAVAGGKIRTSDEQPELPEAMTPTLKKQVVYFAKLALRMPEVRRILDLFYQVANRRRPRRWESRFADFDRDAM